MAVDSGRVWPVDAIAVQLAVADAVDEVKAEAAFVTTRPGGHGAVREICDLILAAQGLDDKALDGIRAL